MVDSVQFPDEHDITAEWLATALGVFGAQLTETRVSIGTGQVGENVRFSIKSDHPNLPTSVVGKFPSLDETSRQTAVATDAYVKEIGFYRDLQHTVKARTPRIHFLAEDLANNRFLLLMEDINDAVQGDQLAGCSVDQARLAVDQLVGLHAPHWGSTQLADLAWMRPRTPERGVELSGLYAAVFEGFATRYRARLSAAVIELGRQFGALIPRWFGAGQTPITLVHGDYRLDNMLFGSGGDAPPLTIVDWQTTAIGHGPADLAYFLGAGLLTADRRDSEESLISRYVDGLQGAGVAVDRDVIGHDYAVGSASGYLMAVIASQIVAQTERGDEMFCVMAERHAQQMVDRDLLALF